MSSPPRAQIRRILTGDSQVPFAVRYWDGTEDRFGAGNPVFRIVFRSPFGLAGMLRGGLGFGEAYMACDIDLEGDIRRMFVVLNALKPRLGIVDVLHLVWYNLRLAAGASLSSARKNAQHHYDLGNDFFRLWLDNTLSYSCAYFEEPSFTLEQAQTAKLDHICRKLMLRRGERFLDIGCGWGTLLFHAVEHYRVQGMGITLSEEQARHAQAEIVRRGLQSRATVAVSDYRSIQGTFDKIASVGMFEHVGKRAMPVYFQRVQALLAESGLTLLHTIGRKGWLPTGQGQWARKYIFPGGYLPEAEEIFEAAAATTLVPLDLENLKQHYTCTLDAWAQRFEASLDRVRSLGFDERFIRMWRFFLYGSAEHFRTGVLQLYQVTFINGWGRLPRTRRHLYVAAPDTSDDTRRTADQLFVS